MVFAARLTQHGHTIQNMADLMDLYHQSYSQKTVENIAGLPHPTVQKFMVITVAVVGASRRFLAQITRHQNEVKYMSASLQSYDIIIDNVMVLSNIKSPSGKQTLDFGELDGKEITGVGYKITFQFTSHWE
jgi:hypothetical protein